MREWLVYHPVHCNLRCVFQNYQTSLSATFGRNSLRPYSISLCSLCLRGEIFLTDSPNFIVAIR